MIGFRIAMFLIKLLLLSQVAEVVMYGTGIWHQIYGLLCFVSTIGLHLIEMIYILIRKKL